MEILNISGHSTAKTKQPQKNVWYKDFVIILFLITMLSLMVFGEVQVA